MIPVIFFNASVILAGLKSPKGASANTLSLVQKRKAKGIISEVAHIIASAFETQAYFLVTLDKKHLLALKDKVKKTHIISPGDLINRIKNSKNNIK